MNEQPSFVVRSAAHTLFSSATESLIRQVYPGATVRREYLDLNGTSTRMFRVEMDASGRWMLLGTDLTSREIAHALSQGAWAIVPVDAEVSEFRLALHALVDGEAPYIGAEVSRRIAADVLVRQRGANPGGAVPVVLTSRERQVLTLVSRGDSNAEIAHSLEMSPNTVRTHLQTLFTKFQVQSRLKMLARARELGIAEADG